MEPRESLSLMGRKFKTVRLGRGVRTETRRAEGQRIPKSVFCWRV